MLDNLNTLKIFFESPLKEFNVRGIARILEIAPATASKQLKKFAKKQVLIEKKERGFNLYKANLEGVFYHDLKVFYNLTKIRKSGIIESLNKFYFKPIIILFGSFAKATDIAESDIDLAIISENKKDFPELKEFENKLKREIQLFVVKDLKEIKNKYLLNNILNGIVIQGEVKWI